MLFELSGSWVSLTTRTSLSRVMRVGRDDGELRPQPATDEVGVGRVRPGYTPIGSSRSVENVPSVLPRKPVTTGPVKQSNWPISHPPARR